MKTIRQLRRDQGWTQFELALRVGVQPQAVYLWERGRRMPQVPQLRKLGQAFGICSDDIVLEPDTPEPRPARQERHRGKPPSRDAEERTVTQIRHDGLS